MREESWDKAIPTEGFQVRTLNVCHNGSRNSEASAILALRRNSGAVHARQCYTTVYTSYIVSRATMNLGVRSRISGHADGWQMQVPTSRCGCMGAKIFVGFPAAPLHQMKLFRNVPGVALKRCETSSRGKIRYRLHQRHSDKKKKRENYYTT